MAINYNAAPANGIDQQIRDKADSLRSQMTSSGGIEAEIQNRATKAMGFNINRDLVDLLALQKLKSEKEQAAQEMQMAMEQNPGTIAEQRANEVTGQIRGEIQGELDKVSQVGKTLRLKDQQQKHRLQQAAAGRQPNAPFGIPAAAQAQRRVPPAQVAQRRVPVNPRGIGIAAAPVSNIPRAAGGGIVSFANQGWVNPRTGKQFSDAALKMLGVTSPEWARMSDAERGALIQQFNEYQWAAQEGASRSELLEKEISTDDPLATEEAIPGPATGGPKDRIPILQDFENIMSTDEMQGVTGSGRDPYSDVSILPPDAVAEEPVVPGAAPAPAPEVVDPLATIDRSILDPLTNVGLPTSTVEYQDPFKTKEGKQIVKDQGLLQDWQAGERARDPVAERIAAMEAADLQTGKQGIADLNKQQVAEMKKHYGDQAAQRKKDQWENLLAYGGGQGALSDIARGAWGMRHAGYGRDTSQLKGLQALQQYGQEQTTAAGKVAIEAGTEQMKMTEAARTEAGRSEAQLLEQQGDQLSETAKQYLEAGKANQTEQAALRNDKVLLAVKNVDAATKLAIADREYVISKEANDLRGLAITSQDMRTLVTAQLDADQRMGMLAAEYDDMASKTLIADMTYIRMEDGPKKDAYAAKILLQFKDAENLARAELIETKKMLQDKLEVMIAALPPEVSASKFTNVRQTSP